jgi:hypothetical protein
MHGRPIRLLVAQTAAETWCWLAAGNDLFPEIQSQRHRGHARDADLAQSNKCFSILLRVSSGSDPGEMTNVAVHLEVPPYGNGRDRNEWVSAFHSLMCKKLPLFEAALSASSAGNSQGSR